MLASLNEMGEVSFHSIGTNSFHVEAKNERFSATGLHCRQNLRFENVTSLADYVKEMYLNCVRTCSTIVFPHSTNHDL